MTEASVNNSDNIDYYVSTYLINLKRRKDRREHVEEQFKGKKEFKKYFVEAIEHPIGAVGLWQSIVKTIQLAKKKKDDIIIVCEDDHLFTTNYNKSFLFYNIAKAGLKEAELLMGGVSGFGTAVPVSSNLYWIDWYWGNQFIVIFQPLYQAILNYRFKETDEADLVLSSLTKKKMVLYPFISIQKNFGYSDVTKHNNDNPKLIDNYFIETSQRLRIIHSVNHYFNYSTESV